LIESAANIDLSPSPSQPAVALENVSKLFGRFAALHDVSISFRGGRLHALLGENGAGKSTLLRIIAGLSRPTHGTVRVLGSSELRSLGQRIGYMAHATLLYDDLTARENLAYFQGLYGRHLATEVDQLLATVGLDAVDPKRRVSQFSQGMKQRLALARALVPSPDLLLLDEPFSNVDGKSIAAMAELMGRLRNQGTTLIVITHQLEALAQVADEWITMHAGTIVRRALEQNSATLGQAGEP
jgi:ABC-type multidrug transport system ATPase subunit